MGLHQQRAREDLGKALPLRAVGMKQLQGTAPVLQLRECWDTTLGHRAWTVGWPCTELDSVTLVGPFQLRMLCGSVNSAEHGCKERRSLSWHVV